MHWLIVFCYKTWCWAVHRRLWKKNIVSEKETIVYLHFGNPDTVKESEYQCPRCAYTWYAVRVRHSH